mmetsp:Transcript_3744/g.11652  ORF Transcript_3744/g.11652 Transcript_3744/m.11652 type:complete len:208 (+) Transcript_3744:719-1342(+)
MDSRRGKNTLGRACASQPTRKSHSRCPLAILSGWALFRSQPTRASPTWRRTIPPRYLPARQQVLSRRMPRLGATWRLTFRAPLPIVYQIRPRPLRRCHYHLRHRRPHRRRSAGSSKGTRTFTLHTAGVQTCAASTTLTTASSQLPAWPATSRPRTQPSACTATSCLCTAPSSPRYTWLLESAVPSGSGPISLCGRPSLTPSTPDGVL